MTSNRSRTPTPPALDDADSLAQMSALDTPLSSAIQHPMLPDGPHPYCPNVAPDTGLAILTTSPGRVFTTFTAGT